MTAKSGSGATSRIMWWTSRQFNRGRSDTNPVIPSLSAQWSQYSASSGKRVISAVNRIGFRSNDRARRSSNGPRSRTAEMWCPLTASAVESEEPERLGPVVSGLERQGDLRPVEGRLGDDVV